MKCYLAKNMNTRTKNNAKVNLNNCIEKKYLMIIYIFNDILYL